jgi:hypothetical protein
MRGVDLKELENSLRRISSGFRSFNYTEDEILKLDRDTLKEDIIARFEEAYRQRKPRSARKNAGAGAHDPDPRR